MIFTCVKGANAKLQIHKYTNTACVEVPERPNMWYIFEKRISKRISKNYIQGQVIPVSGFFNCNCGPSSDTRSYCLNLLSTHTVTHQRLQNFISTKKVKSH